VESFTDVHEFTPADHQVSVDLEDIPPGWSLSPADHAYGFAQLPIAEGESLAEDLGDDLAPDSRLRLDLDRCLSDGCTCANDARRAVAKGFANSVDRTVSAAGWVRADIGVPMPDLHFAKRVYNTLLYGSALTRSEYHFDAATLTVRVTQADEQRTWRPVDEPREDLRFVWESADDVQRILGWPAAKARTVVMLCHPAVTRRLSATGSESLVAKLEACAAPLGDDPVNHERFQMLAGIDRAQDPHELVQAVLAAAVTDTP
jgi:hypothetical protein